MAVQLGRAQRRAARIRERAPRDPSPRILVPGLGRRCASPGAAAPSSSRGNRCLGPDAGDGDMLHYLVSALFIYIVFLLLFPQQVAAVTLLMVTTVVALVGKLDWTVVPF